MTHSNLEFLATSALVVGCLLTSCTFSPSSPTQTALFDPTPKPVRLIPTPTNSYQADIPSTEIEVVPKMRHIEPSIVEIVENPATIPSVHSAQVRYGGVSSRTSDIAVDKEGRVWTVGNRGVTLWNSVDRTYTRFTTQHGLASNSVASVAISHDGSLWFGTSMFPDGVGSRAGYGISRLDGATWNTYTTTHGLISNDVEYIAVAPDGALWFGAHTGVSRFDGETWMSYPLWGLLGGSPVVHAIDVTPDGSVWFGTDSGVARFDGENWTAYVNLGHDTVLSIASDQSGAVWFASCTGGGVSRFDGATWTTYRFPPDSSRVYLNARSVVAAPDGAIWVGASSELLHFDGEAWYSYNIPHVESMAVAPDGTLWFARYGGEPIRFDGVDWTQYQMSK